MKKIVLLIFTMALLTVTAGCALPLVNKFDPAEAQAALEPGNNTIIGNAFFRHVYGIRECAGLPVQLIPVTAYSTERMRKTFRSTEAGDYFINTFPGFENDDPAFYSEGYRTEVCDIDSYFVFDAVKDGEYYIAARVDGYVWIMNRVSVSGGKTIKVIVIGR